MSPVGLVSRPEIPDDPDEGHQERADRIRHESDTRHESDPTRYSCGANGTHFFGPWRS